MPNNSNVPVNPENVPTDPYAGIDRTVLSWGDPNTVPGHLLHDALGALSAQSPDAGPILRALSYFVDSRNTQPLVSQMALGERLIRAVSEPLQTALTEMHAQCSDDGCVHMGPGTDVERTVDEIMATILMQAANNMADLCASWPTTRDALESALAS